MLEKRIKMHGLMNNTKWDELRSLKYNIPGSVRWRMKNIKTGIISEWTDNWELFDNAKWNEIEWLEIEFNNNKTEVLEDLRKIHVPGTFDEKVARILGYNKSNEFIDYI